MGCEQSIPIESLDLDQMHEVDPTIKCLGAPQESKQKVVVQGKLFSWSGNSFAIIPTMTGSQTHSIGDGLRVRGKAFSNRDQMVLEYGPSNEVVAVCLRMFSLGKPTFYKIYTTTPNYIGQEPSDRKFDSLGTLLYTYAKFERENANRKNVYLEQTATTKENVSGSSSQERQKPNYIIQTYGSVMSTSRFHVVIDYKIQHENVPAALIQHADREFKSYALTIAPGIDPYMMICICSICDEMDTSERRRRRDD